MSAVGEVFGVFLRLGLTSFGGPVAHIGYFREEFVSRRRWLDDQAFADLVALCQFLPGPASSQVGMSLGLLRAGVVGAVAAWIGFTLPSALALAAFAQGLTLVSVDPNAGWLHGLKLVAVAVVAQAVWTMARSLTPDRTRGAIAIAAAIAVLVWPVAPAQVLAIALGGLIGWRLWPHQDVAPGEPIAVPLGRTAAAVAWTALGLLLIGLPLLRQATEDRAVAVFDAFFRTGSLVFGGGHVVLPLLHGEVVPSGWVTDDRFVAGYGAAQAVPGPLFTFSAFLGAAMDQPIGGWDGALLAVFAVFLPSFLLVFGALPFWGKLRGRQGVQGTLRGVNAAVVGLLLAALYDPVWTSAVGGPLDFALVLFDLALLTLWRLPPWLVVVVSAVAATGLP